MRKGTSDGNLEPNARRLLHPFDCESKADVACVYATLTMQLAVQASLFVVVPSRPTVEAWVPRLRAPVPLEYVSRVDCVELWKQQAGA
jgi:hypothetical protein